MVRVRVVGLRVRVVMVRYRVVRVRGIAVRLEQAVRVIIRTKAVSVTT